MAVAVDTVDVLLDSVGSITGLTPLTQRGRDWIAENCQAEDWQRTGLTLNVDARRDTDILLGMLDDGLIVRYVRNVNEDSDAP